MLRVAPAQTPQLTTITDVAYRANGQPAAGSLVISWPAFSTQNNRAIVAGQATVAIGASGVVSVALAPNEGARPAGSFYKVIYKLDDGTTATEYWTVPLLSPTTIGAIRAQLVPPTVAAQFLTRQDFDALLSSDSQGLVHRTGNETIAGAKTFTAPIVSTAAAGTPPLSVSSSTKVAGLNADMVDGVDGATVLMRPNTRRWAYVVANGAGGFTAAGETIAVNGSCTTNVAAVGTDPAMTDCIQTTPTINTAAAINGSAGLWRTGRNLSLQWTGRLRENTSVRAWVGFTDQTVSAMAASDNPAGNYAVFRFSTSASDANVKCVTKDGATQNVQPTTLADMTATHSYEITEDVSGGRWHFYVDGNEVCGTGLATSLPAANTNLRYVAEQQNLVSTVRNLDIAWVQITGDK
jgi:hypothetical protein